jgi:hypothetical protein
MKVTLAEMFSVARRAGATRLPTYLIVQPPSDPQFSEDGDQIITHPHPRSYRLGDDPLRHVGASRALPLSPGAPLSDGRPATRSAVTRPPSSPPFPSQRSLEPPTSLSTYKSRSHSSRKRPPLLSRHFRHRTWAFLHARSCRHPTSLAPLLGPIRASPTIHGLATRLLSSYFEPRRLLRHGLTTAICQNHLRPHRRHPSTRGELNRRTLPYVALLWPPLTASELASATEGIGVRGKLRGV